MTSALLENTLALRLALAAGIILAGLLLYWAANQIILIRARLHARIPQSVDSRPAAATLLYFTTPTCAPCKTIQRPAIQRLREQVGEALQVIEIDATQQPEVAGEWGVMSVPTTFILDASGAPRFVNHGVAPLDKLMRQINNLEPFRK